MLSLNYTIEKDGITLSEINKLMLNEYQINDLMDSLVAHGYTVEAMSVATATLQEMKGYKMINSVKTIECQPCSGRGYIFIGDNDDFWIEPCECVADELLN